MNITPEQLKEFKDLYMKEFGEDISDEKAIEFATQFLNLLTATYKPDDISDTENS